MYAYTYDYIQVQYTTHKRSPLDMIHVLNVYDIHIHHSYKCVCYALSTRDSALFLNVIYYNIRACATCVRPEAPGMGEGTDAAGEVHN